MLKADILNILQNPHTTMEQQAEMLAAMLRKRSRAINEYIKAQAQETIQREREQYQDRIDQAYMDGLASGYYMGFNDGRGLQYFPEGLDAVS